MVVVALAGRGAFPGPAAAVHVHVSLRAPKSRSDAMRCDEAATDGPARRGRCGGAVRCAQVTAGRSGTRERARARAHAQTGQDARWPGAHVAAPRTGVPCEILGAPDWWGAGEANPSGSPTTFVIGFPRESPAVRVRPSTGTLWGPGSAHAHTLIPRDATPCDALPGRLVCWLAHRAVCRGWPLHSHTRWTVRVNSDPSSDQRFRSY